MGHLKLRTSPSTRSSQNRIPFRGWRLTPSGGGRRFPASDPRLCLRGVKVMALKFSVIWTSLSEPARLVSQELMNTSSSSRSTLRASKSSRVRLPALQRVPQQCAVEDRTRNGHVDLRLLPSARSSPAAARRWVVHDEWRSPLRPPSRRTGLAQSAGVAASCRPPYCRPCAGARAGGGGAARLGHAGGAIRPRARDSFLGILVCGLGSHSVWAAVPQPTRWRL